MNKKTVPLLFLILAFILLFSWRFIFYGSGEIIGDDPLCIEEVEEGLSRDNHREVRADELSPMEINEFGWSDGCLMSYLLSCAETGEDFSIARIMIKRYEKEDMKKVLDYFKEEEARKIYTGELGNPRVGEASFSFSYKYPEEEELDYEIVFIRGNNLVKLKGVGSKIDYSELLSTAREVDFKLRFSNPLTGK